MTDTSVELCGLKLDNPVVPASGTFGYGNEFREFYDINILGSFSFKGTTREARFGNPTPRIAECGAGMINAVGLQNPGIDAVIREELPRLKTFFRKPVIANISGFSVEEYAYCCERIDRQEQVGLIEVNVSCPNVRHGGMSFGTCPDAAAEVTRAVKAVTTKPVFIKLSRTSSRSPGRARRRGPTASARSIRCWACVSTLRAAVRSSPTRWADSRAPRSSPLRCGWSTRWPGRAGFP